MVNYRKIDQSWNKELITNQIGRNILGNYGYTCVHSLDKDHRFFEKMDLAYLDPGTDFGVDDRIYTKEIPIKDPCNIKNTVSFNNDGDFYSIDYKSNNFNSRPENEDYIFVKLLKFKPKRYFQDGKFWEMVKKGKAEKYYKLNGLLNHNKQTDFLFYIKHTNNKNIETPNNLINAYLIPFNSLKSKVISNLNQIRVFSEINPLKLEMSNLDLLFGIHETWDLYKENSRKYDFELLKIKDLNPRSNHDLMMKIHRQDLLNYILFNGNGEIVENISY